MANNVKLCFTKQFEDVEACCIPMQYFLEYFLGERLHYKNKHIVFYGGSDKADTLTHCPFGCGKITVVESIEDN